MLLDVSSIFRRYSENCIVVLVSRISHDFFSLVGYCSTNVDTIPGGEVFLLSTRECRIQNPARTSVINTTVAIHTPIYWATSAEK